MSKKILVIGDSWSSAVVSGDPASGGWPEMLGIPEAMRQAVAGSTAQQWADDFEGRLGIARRTPADVVILSLLGNDMRAALADGTITLQELRIGIASFRQVLARTNAGRTIVLLYADPSGGRDPRMGVAVELLNQMIRLAAFSARHHVETLDTRCVLCADNFLGGDGLHPNKAGHEAIAWRIKQLLEDE